MKQFIKYTSITALMFGVLSCTNLDEQIKSNFTTAAPVLNPGVGVRDNLNKGTPTDGLSGAFTKLADGTATNGGFFQASELGTDEAVIAQKGGDWFDGGVYIALHKHQLSPVTASINDAWNQAYAGIFQCNDILPTVASDPAKVAQLRFLRAYFYWRLCDMFGNVKLSTLPGNTGAQVSRTTIFNFIETELLAAVPDLPAGKGDYARGNQSAAWALLCRLYLNAEVYTGTPRYADAVTMANNVINRAAFSLSPEYKDIFSYRNLDNVEHIFVVPFDETTQTGMNIAQMTLHYPSQLTYNLAEQPWNGYATLEEFYNSYDPADKRRTNNFIVGPQVDVAGNPILDLAFDKADEDGAPINYTPKINELFPNSSRQAGARLGKFSFKLKQRQSMDNDYPLLRWSEVLLNKAEALFRMNGYGDATGLATVNILRARAGVTPFVSLTAGQFLAERGRELFIEGLRRSDLIRFGAYGNAWWEKPAVNNPNFNLMAIPLQQMQVPGAGLTQNPGYPTN
ncbi:MAG: RagB/SusD family nutrient uptake outer membrane protein [Cyclobacteriaceae bacterium]|nr:RagB/SusD family nutrient uptake outer membrane protein [Cyclobacteriaceae bacterium]